MGVIDVQYRTVTCDACSKTVTYEHPAGLAAAVEANLWIKTGRFVQTSDQRTFLYCSDLCTIAGVETGLLNFQEPAKVAIAQGSAQAQIAAAAAAAKQQEAATAAIKSGGQITIK
jgi:hypothetical protein